jgi:hypothetical protein
MVSARVVFVSSNCLRMQELGEAHIREIVAGGNSREVSPSVERGFDAPAWLIETLTEAERLFPVGAVRDDWLGFLTQFGAVVRLVAEQALRCLYSANQVVCGTIPLMTADRPPAQRLAHPSADAQQLAALN